MRKLMTIMAVLFCFVASAQYTPTGSKTRWINGVGLSSTRDTALFTSAADTNIVTTWNGNIYWKGTGYWNKIGHASNVGAQIHDSLYANYALKAGTSAGGRFISNGGSVVAEWASGGGTNFDFHGFAGYNANRASSYTSRSFTDKNYVDSSRALDVQLAGTQTITGSKTFSSDLTFSATQPRINSAGALRIANTNDSTIYFSQNGSDKWLMRGITGYLVGNQQSNLVGVNTADGSENGSLILSGSRTPSSTNGGTIALFGSKAILPNPTYASDVHIFAGLGGDVFLGTVRGVDSLSQDGIGISKDSQVVSIIGYTNLKKVDTGLGSDSLLVKDIFGKVKKISSINSLLGNYLPLTGGVISGSSSTPLEVNSNTASTFMAMKDNSGIYTYLGSDDGDFIVQTPSGGFTNKLVVKNSGVINTLSRLNINGATDNSSFQLNVTGAGIISGNLTASSFVKSGGTSSQYLMADGSTTTSYTQPISSIKTSTYTISSTDYHVLVSGAGGAFTVTLPTAVGITGRIYIITRTDVGNSGGSVTLAANGSETIGGYPTFAFGNQTFQYCLGVQSDGTNWQIISR